MKIELDPDEIRNYEQDRFFRTQDTEKSGPNGVTIFLAVLAAILVSWFIREQYLAYQAGLAIEAFNQEMKAINEQSQRQIEAINQRNQEMLRQQREKQEAELEFKQQQIQLQKEQQQKIEEERQSQNLANQEKDEAWKAYYKPSVGCESSNQNRDMIKCSNEYIKAKRNFEASWKRNS